MILENLIASDGSRRFLSLPQSIHWDRLFTTIKDFQGITDPKIITDGIVEVWLDFKYKGHTFSVNNQLGEYWFFVEDPDCPDEVLMEIAKNCYSLMGNS